MIYSRILAKNKNENQQVKKEAESPVLEKANKAETAALERIEKAVKTPSAPASGK